MTKYKAQSHQNDVKEKQETGLNTNSMQDNGDNLYTNVGNFFNG